MTKTSHPESAALARTRRLLPRRADWAHARPARDLTAGLMVALVALPLALGFVGAWSMPITSSEGKVLGTFGTYFRDRRSPTPKETKGVGFLAKAAAAVLAQV